MKTVRFVCIAYLIGSIGCELPSDEEIRQDLVGTWERCDCGFPYDIEDSDLPEGPLLHSTSMTFLSSGRFGEFVNGSLGYCELDTCSDPYPNGYYDFCTCSWQVSDGYLQLFSDGNTDLRYLDRSYRIKSIDSDNLVIDNVDLGYTKTKKACYKK